MAFAVLADEALVGGRVCERSNAIVEADQVVCSMLRVLIGRALNVCTQRHKGSRKWWAGLG
jgi:hypothetical protein